jgi:D-alanyl-D-alanine carboxypeptidase/D-alanyl-D-alanine-endopeptidase (penicillin-binding protein 4)
MSVRLVGLALAACAVALAMPAQATQTPPPQATQTPSEAVALPPPPRIPPAPVPSTPPSPGLVTRLEQLQDFPQTRPHGTIGLAVLDGTAQRLTSHNPNKPMLPASTMKLVTAAAALRLLGPQHRFVTRVYATGPIDASGVIDGDLVLVGGGDPVLATPRFIRDVNDIRPATRLADLAAAVARAGVTRVTGRVIGDPSILADEPLADGWADDYLTSLDATRSSGLTVDVGLRLFERSGVLHAEAAKDPAIRAADQLRELLEARDVRVEQAAASRRGLDSADIEIARISSPPLDELLTHALRTSDNHLADGIFRMLGAATGDPTWAGSERAARGALSDAGNDRLWARSRLADGSGLSRYNRLTAETTVRLLHTMASSPLRADWLRLQATAGETGTMQQRLAGTQAKGRVYAKTGTLRDVRSLAGTVPGPDGRDHHFAVFANDLKQYSDIAAARRLADVMALALVVEQDGCRGPIPVPDTTTSQAPETVICGTKQSK